MVTSQRSLVAIVALCAALAVNAFVLGPMWILAPAATFSETAAIPAFGWSQRISWVLLVLLIPLLPALIGPGRRGTPPAWITPTVQASWAAQTSIHFVQGFVLMWLLPLAPELLDLTAGGSLQLAMTVVQGVFLLVNVALAVMLWRAGHSRVGAVLLALGAVITLGFGPFGAGLLALGLGLIALRALRARSTDAQHEQAATYA